MTATTTPATALTLSREGHDRVRAYATAVRDLATEAAQLIPAGSAGQSAGRGVSNLLAAVVALEAERGVEAVVEAMKLIHLRAVELASNFEDHPDGLSRALSVMRRCAADLLGDHQGEAVAAWAGKLERGDHAAG